MGIAGILALFWGSIFTLLGALSLLMAIGEKGEAAEGYVLMALGYLIIGGPLLFYGVHELLE